MHFPAIYSMQNFEILYPLGPIMVHVWVKLKLVNIYRIFWWYNFEKLIWTLLYWKKCLICRKLTFPHLFDSILFSKNMFMLCHLVPSILDILSRTRLTFSQSQNSKRLPDLIAHKNIILLIYKLSILTKKQRLLLNSVTIYRTSV